MRFTGKVTHVFNKSRKTAAGRELIAYQYRIQERVVRIPQSLLLTAGKNMPVLSEGDEVEVDYIVKCLEKDGRLLGANIATRIVKYF